MNKRKFIQHHKWFGLLISFFLLMFCVSGILLNHRQLISDINVSRTLLPQRYEYSQWNGGLLRGTLPVDSHILIYGASGIFLTDSTAAHIADFNEGLPTGADYRQIRNVVSVGGSAKQLFAVSQLALYRFGMHGKWHTEALPLADSDELLTDIAAHGDTLVVLSRSHAYIAVAPYTQFRRIDLPAPPDYKDRATAFRTVWLLHSGELFGTAGKLLVDAVAVVLIVLIVTGFAFFCLRKTKRRWQSKGRTMKHTLRWHNLVGRKTIVATILICATGWCLRPPMMVALALTKVPTLPFTTLKSANPWHDKLRLVRYDSRVGDWLLSASEGYFSLGSDISKPHPMRIVDAPPQNVMGLNVWQQREDGMWLCGSFGGMCVWNRRTGTATDYFTGRPVPRKPGPPLGKKAISGYSSDFRVCAAGQKCTNTKKSVTEVVTDYYDGTTKIVQPESLRRLPMSLWNAALEVHTCRIYMHNTATYIFIFFFGIAVVWCLWTGLKLKK